MSVVFCTYLTIYSGNKLPPFYVGSTSINKIQNGYRGSVSSKAYKGVWLLELKENPDLFKTIILSKHETRTEALEKENKLHKLLAVCTNPLYVNKSNAIPNGIFGMIYTGKHNPMYGRKRPDSSERMKIKNPMFNKEISDIVVSKKKELYIRGLHKSTRNSEDTLLIASNRMSKENPNRTRCSCVFCQKETTPSALSRFHKICVACQ